MPTWGQAPEAVLRPAPYLRGMGPNHEMLYAVAHALEHERREDSAKSPRLQGAAAPRRQPGLEAASEVTIRRAALDDERALFDLAVLSNERPLAGEILVVEVDGEVRAACSVGDGRTVSDPFRPSLAACSLLELRRAHILDARTGLPVGARRRFRFLRRFA
jgi:hypothetical protein